MEGKFRGYVARGDRMYRFRWSFMSARLGIRESHPAFRVFRFTGSNEVYGYEEKHSRAKVICKFYGKKYGDDADRAAQLAYREYDSLQTLRGDGLDGSPHHVIAPLAFE